MVSVEELKQKFPVQTVAPYGECVVVPGSEFDPDWEAELADQGYSCFMQSLKGQAVTLVRLQKASASKDRGVQLVSGVEETVQQQPKTARYGKAWPPELEALIIKLWESDASARAICAEVRRLDPNRTDGAITGFISRLRARGKLVSRYKSHKKRTSRKNGTAASSVAEHKEKRPLAKSGTVKDESSVKQRVEQAVAEIESGKVELPSHGSPTPSTPVCPGPEPVRDPSEQPPASPRPVDPVQSLLTEIRDFLRKPELTTFSFHYHCRHCRSGGSCYDEEEVWRVCPRCGEPLVVWNVEEREG